MGNKHIVMSGLVSGGSASSDFSVLWSVFSDWPRGTVVGVDHCILQKEVNTMHLVIH
jgi:hypothetical protein